MHWTTRRALTTIANQGHTHLDTMMLDAIHHDNRVAHISTDNGETSLCGTRLNGKPATTTGRCIVCLDLAQTNRFNTR